MLKQVYMQGAGLASGSWHLACKLILKVKANFMEKRKANK